MFHFHKHHIKRTLLGLLGITLLAGSLTACGHHHGEYGANMTAEGVRAQARQGGEQGRQPPGPQRRAKQNSPRWVMCCTPSVRP